MLATGEAMDLKRLRTFMAVADLGSVTLAAERLHIAQPALSRHIRLLEDELGVRLFDRDGRGMTLTPPAERLHGKISALFRDLEEMRAEVSGLAEEAQGSIVVGMPPTCTEVFGSSLVRRFLVDYPRISLCIVTGLSGHLFDWLQRGDIDTAFMYGPPQSGSIVIEPLATERLALIGSPRGVLPPASTIDFSTAAGLPLVLPAQRHGLRRMLEAAAYALGHRLNVRVETDSLRIQVELVINEPFFTVIARKAVQRDIDNGAIAVWDITNPILKRDLMFAVPGNRPITSAMRIFRETVRSVVTTDFLTGASEHGQKP